MWRTATTCVKNCNGCSGAPQYATMIAAAGHITLQYFMSRKDYLESNELPEMTEGARAIGGLINVNVYYYSDLHY
jgi:hypothetical protein